MPQHRNPACLSASTPDALWNTLIVVIGELLKPRRRREHSATRWWTQFPQRSGMHMTTPVVSSTAFIPGVASNESNAALKRAYRTKTSFVAVHFDEAGKGPIVFLPQGAMFHVIGRSSCLPGVVVRLDDINVLFPRLHTAICDKRSMMSAVMRSKRSRLCGGAWRAPASIRIGRQHSKDDPDRERTKAKHSRQ
jgi:hypothetical protein